jgi:putative aminopeptidase FrvX
MYPVISDDPILSLFAETLSVPSPCGYEGGLAQIVRDKLDLWNYSPETDGAGNVWVVLPGRKSAAPLCCFAAHLDEIGMTVTGIEPDGTLRVSRSGGLYPWKLGEGPVQILGDGRAVTGVLSMGSAHSRLAGEELITWDRVRILTGLSRDQLRAAGVRPGAPAVPALEVRGPVLFGDESDPLVGAWTFDDRMGVVALLHMLQVLQRDGLQPLHPTVIAFTVHEEDGGYGAKTLAHRLKPELFVAIDGCPITPGSELEMDGRPGVWAKDRLATYDYRIIQALCASADQAGTELQPVVYDSTASDAGMVFAAGGAARVACFGHVRENSHGYEVARLSVFGNVVRTLVQFVTEWKG